jgi:hypothetical protein
MISYISIICLSHVAQMHIKLMGLSNYLVD